MLIAAHFPRFFHVLRSETGRYRLVRLPANYIDATAKSPNHRSFSLFSLSPRAPPAGLHRPRQHRRTRSPQLPPRSPTRSPWLQSCSRSRTAPPQRSPTNSTPWDPAIGLPPCTESFRAAAPHGPRRPPPHLRAATTGLRRRVNIATPREAPLTVQPVRRHPRALRAPRCEPVRPHPGNSTVARLPGVELCIRYSKGLKRTQKTGTQKV
ncbi:hypothetical protein BRADI_2g48901v3 [Brachypodium distachyon]|uniref:Uncharacterized protein n=1 Tax=Brachypodium distachyon TaxID=15368 RepID=A0A2K2DET0_BRADI|nr:hypothetical protein BRADI_2g48901v3 [Brachypodium distachyon]